MKMLQSKDGSLLVLFCICILLIHLDNCNGSKIRSIYGNFLQGIKISGNTKETHLIDSWVRCVTLCLDQTDCFAVSIACEVFKGVQGVCELKTLMQPSYTVLGDPTMCTMVLGNYTLPGIDTSVTSETPTTNTPVAEVTAVTSGTMSPNVITTEEIFQMTTPSTAISDTTAGTNEPYILAAVESLQDMCFVGSTYDITIFTRDGIYIYDNDISNGPCKGPLALSSVFTGYTNLPNIADIDAVLSYEVNQVELYANEYVWKWQASSTHVTKYSGFRKTIQNHINVNAPTSPDWAIFRGRNGKQRFFYEGGVYYMYCEQGCTTQTFSKTDKLLDQNNNNLNVWSSLPPDVASVCSVDNQHLQYLVFDKSGNYFDYRLDYSADPVITVTSKGPVPF